MDRRTVGIVAGTAATVLLTFGLEVLVLDNWPWWLYFALAGPIVLFLWWYEYRRKQRIRDKMELFDSLAEKTKAWLPGSSPPPAIPKDLPSLLDPEFTRKMKDTARRERIAVKR